MKLQDRIPSEGLRQRLGLDDIISVQQQNRLRWYGHVLQNEDNDWVKKCMEHEVESARTRGRPKKTWREIVEKNCQVRGLNREDAMDRKGTTDDHDRCEWVNVSSGTGSPGLFWTKSKEPLNGCMCVLCVVVEYLVSVFLTAEYLLVGHCLFDDGT